MKNIQQAITLLELTQAYVNTLSPYAVDARLASTDSFQQDDGITFSAVVHLSHVNNHTSVVFRMKNDTFSYEVYNQRPHEVDLKDPASYTRFQQTALRELEL